MKNTYIYILIDPVSNEVKYVGKSNDPFKRLKIHLNEKRNNTYKEQWIHGLLNKGIMPILDIIDEVAIQDWSFWEQWWIATFKSWGFKLTNIGIGGEGGNITEEIRKKISESKKGTKSRLGKKLTNEQKINISNSLKGRKLSTQHIINKASGCFKEIDVNVLKEEYIKNSSYSYLSELFSLSKSKIYRTLVKYELIKKPKNKIL